MVYGVVFEGYEDGINEGENHVLAPRQDKFLIGFNEIGFPVSYYDNIFRQLAFVD